MASTSDIFGDNQWTNDGSLPSAGLELSLGLSPFGDSGLDRLFLDAWDTSAPGEHIIVSTSATMPQPIPVPNSPVSGPITPPTIEGEPKAKCKWGKAKKVNVGEAQFPTPTRDNFLEIQNTLPIALPTSRIQTAVDGTPSATDIENAQANPSAPAPPVPVPTPVRGSVPVTHFPIRPTQNIRARAKAIARKRKDKDAKTKNVPLPVALLDTPFWNLLPATSPTLPSNEPQPRSAEDLEIRATTAPGTMIVPPAQPPAIQKASQNQAVASIKASVSKKRKLDEIAEPSGKASEELPKWFCDFCEVEFKMLYVKDHYRRVPCKQNKLKYEFIHGAVPSWWRKEHGHHGSHVRPQELCDSRPEDQKQEGQRCDERCEERREMWKDYTEKHPEVKIKEILTALAAHHAPPPVFPPPVTPVSFQMPLPQSLSAPLPMPPAKKPKPAPRRTKARRSTTESTVAGSLVPSPQLSHGTPVPQTSSVQVSNAPHTNAMSHSYAPAAPSDMGAQGGQPWVYPVNPSSYTFANAVGSSSRSGVQIGQTSNENLYGPGPIANAGSYTQYTLPSTATGNIPQYLTGPHVYYLQQPAMYGVPMGQMDRSLLPNPAVPAMAGNYYSPHDYAAALPINYGMPMVQSDRSLLPIPAAPAMGGALNDPHGYAAAALAMNYSMPMGQTDRSLLHNPAAPAMGGDYYGPHGYAAAPLEMGHGMPVDQAGGSLLPNPAAPAMEGTYCDPHGYTAAELAANELAMPPADSFDDDYPWLAAFVNQHHEEADGGV